MPNKFRIFAQPLFQFAAAGDFQQCVEDRMLNKTVVGGTGCSLQQRSHSPGILDPSKCLCGDPAIGDRRRFQKSAEGIE